MEGGYAYMGQWDNDQPHGLGAFTFASGVRYEGMWQEGKYEGTGTLTWPDGRQYKVDLIMHDQEPFYPHHT